MKIRVYLIAVLFLILVYGVVQAATGSLATNVTTDGGCEGSFINVTAGPKAVYITGFDTVFVGAGYVRVYFRPGPYQGFENTAGAWQYLGGEHLTGGSGFIQTLYPLNVGGVTIPAGQTYSFLIYSGRISSGVYAIRYRGFTTVSVSNADISIMSGAASCGGGNYTPFDGMLPDRAWRGVVYYTDPPPTPFGFADGRINQYDAAAPFAIYAHLDDDGGVGMVVYDAYTTDHRLLVVSAAQIAAVPEHPDANTLIAASADGRVSVYRLTDGSFQVQGPTYNGKEYVVQFATIAFGTEYESHEQE